MLSSEKKKVLTHTKKRTSLISNQTLVDQFNYLSVAGKFGHFTWSHGDDHSLPHSQLKLLAQNQLHRFTVGSHDPGVIQHFAITMTSAVVEHHLKKDRMSIKGKLMSINKLQLEKDLENVQLHQGGTWRDLSDRLLMEVFLNLKITS